MAKKKQDLKSIKRKKFLKENKILLGVIGILILVGLGVYAISGNNSSQESQVYGDDEIKMYYFHSRTCPHCHRQNQFNEILKEEYPNLNIIEYEISNSQSVEKLREMVEQYDELTLENFGTPTTIIGDRVNIGYGTDETTGPILREMIEEVQAEINTNWDEETMIRTVELRNQEQQTQ